VDQLAANLVGNAAGAATTAAISGVGNLIHGSSGRDSGPESSPEMAQHSRANGEQSPSNNDREAMAGVQQDLPNSDSGTMPVVLEPGSNACINPSNSTQVLLTGQVASQPSADLIRRFAHQLANPGAAVVDQLAVRTNGVASAGSAPQPVSDARGAGTGSSANAPATFVSPGSAICVSENNGALFLAGTVGSTAELGAVENAVEPMVGSGRLLVHLIIGSMSSGTQVAASTAVGTATTTPLPNNAATSLDSQNAVEQALHSVPSLANVNVQLAADGLHLSGSVDTTQDEQMAADLARQYAAGRTILDNVTVANRAQPPQAQSPR
jgi:osmotically-inducible protein OsmY